MKTFHYVLMAACLAGGLASCSNNDPSEDPTPTISVDKKEITLNTTEASSVQLTAPTGTTWKVSNSSSWLTVTPAEGSGSSTISFKFNNLGYREVTKPVNVTIMVTGASSSTETVNVTLPALDNHAPNATDEAIYPADGATNVVREFRFAWKEATDPDNDKLTYILEYSTDNNTWSKIGEKEGIKSTGYADDSKLFDASTKYYWRVISWDMFGEKSVASKTFTFTTGAAAAGTWGDGEARLYQDNGTKSGKSFTLIVTGDGFTAADMGPGGEWEKASTRAIEGLFNYVEPYKTYRPYLRIWRIGAISEESGISQKTKDTETPCHSPKNTRFGTMRDSESASSAWCGLYDYVYDGQPGALYAAGKPTYGDTKYGTFDYVWGFAQASMPADAQDLLTKDCALLVIQNIATYNGTVNYYDDGSNRTIGFLCRSTAAAGSSQGYENVMVHEIGGHAIGHLADEYFKNAAGTLSAAKVNQTKEWQQRFGWYQNVDVSGQKETCPWAHFFTAKEYKAYYSSVSYIEGARSAAKGIWRPEQTSCMVDNVFHFNAPSRYSIVKQLKAAAGETLSWEEFVNKDYDREKANTGTRVALTPPDFIPLPEPSIIHSTK